MLAMLLLCSFGYGPPSEAGGLFSKPSIPPEDDGTIPLKGPKRVSWKVGGLEGEVFEDWEKAKEYAEGEGIDPKSIAILSNEGRWELGLMVAALGCVMLLLKACEYGYYYFYPPEKEEPNQKEKEKTPLKTESEKSERSKDTEE